MLLLVGILIVTTIFIYLYINNIYAYWKSRNVPHKIPKFPLGNMVNPSKSVKPFILEIADYYKEMKAKGYRHCGFYLTTVPVYIPIDREYIKNILSRDFNYFMNHGIYYNEESDPMSAHLFAIEGEKWKNLRAELTPTFSSGKVKAMFKILINCGRPLEEKLAELHFNKLPLDIKDLVARYTIDTIGSCAFGLDCNSFRNGESNFRKYGMKCLKHDTVRQLKLLFGIAFPKLSKKLGLIVVPKDVNDFFMEIVENTVKYREKNNVVMKDFLQLLIDLKNDKGKLDMNQIAAQVFVFFLAGYETASSIMTYALFELALNRQLQNKVREEIERVLAEHDGEITYDSINDLKYMQQVIDETLRKYPPVAALNRICNRDYKLPDSDLVIEKGTVVMISAYGVHHDEEFYPEPEKFDPDRFSADNKQTPFTFLPFGEGPRICIGMRFGLAQIKVGLVTVLRNYRIRLNENTPKVLTMHKKSNIVLVNNETIYLDIEKL